MRADPDQAHRSRLDPLQLLLVPQRGQPHDDREPPRHSPRGRSDRVARVGDLVVDIGCNDGTLLDGYRAEGLRYLGFDPSNVARYAVAKGYDVVNDFYSAHALRQRRPDQKAKAITSIAMFYDLEHPRTFVADVAEALAESGIWVIELHYLR